MKKLILTTIVLMFIKAISFNFTTTKSDENEQVTKFIEYDLKNIKKENLIKHQREFILKLAESNSELFKITSNFLNELNSNFLSTNEITQIFNSSSLKESLRYPTLKYETNEGLSTNHNVHLALKKGYHSIIQRLLKMKKFNIHKRPYLIGLKRNRDSMDLQFTYAIQGKTNSTKLLYEGDSIEVNKLPINLGYLKGEVTFILSDSITGEETWFKRNF